MAVGQVDGVTVTTLLTITPINSDGSSGALYLTPFSSRAASQEWQWINPPGVSLKRTVNGELDDLTYSQFRKREITLTCDDTDVPAADSAFIGQQVQIEWAQELAYGPGGTPFYPAVTGSIRSDGTYTYYRPVISCRIKSVRDTFKEWAASNSWQIVLEEV